MSIITKKVGTLYRDMVSLQLKRTLSECSDVILINYHKLKSADMTQLRKELKAAGASILVTKNSFMRKILEETQKPAEAITFLDGPMACVFIKNDPAVVSKVLVGFLKEHEALKIQGGFLAQRILRLEDIKTLSKLPPKQVLYQQIAGTLQAPITKLAVSLNQIVAKLAYVIKAVSDKKK